MTDTPIEFMGWSKRYKRIVDDFIHIQLNKPYVNNEDIELMQRTTLSSINDEPIYNHMIVKATSKILLLTAYYTVDIFDYQKMAKLSKLHLEIIGNRFQNPELLEMCI